MRSGKKNVIISIIFGGMFLMSVLIIAFTPSFKTPGVVENGFNQNGSQAPIGIEESTEDSKFNESTLDGPLLAPFIDMASWVDGSSEYSLNGVPNLGKIYDEIGCEYYFLGFIRPDDTAPLTSDGTIRWGWGGYYGLSEKGNDGYQYEGICKSISNIRDRGGDVIVSVGGQLGRAPWTVSQNVIKLRDMYLEIVDAYNLSIIDLDIEESNQGYEENVANAKAIKRLQDARGTAVTLTIPIMPYGFTSTQMNLLRAYIGNGVNIKFINSMTMCYGDEVDKGEDFAEASIRALINAKDQIKSVYAEYGYTITDSESYKLLGATVDIGYENQYNPIFTPEMTREVANFANDVGLGMFSYWCVNRDAMIQYNKAIDAKYTFYDASLNFLENKK